MRSANLAEAFGESIRISLTTALLGGSGVPIAYAATRKGTPGWIRSAFGRFRRRGELRRHPARVRVHRDAGDDRDRHTVPHDTFGVNLYQHGFSYLAAGVELAYLYFQIPLMILVIAPRSTASAASGARPRSNLGASRLQFWRHIGFRCCCRRPRRGDPALRERLRRLRDGVLADERDGPLVPILIGSDVTGRRPRTRMRAQALAFGMFVVLAAMMLFYIPLQRRASRWAK